MNNSNDNLYILDSPKSSNSSNSLSNMSNGTGNIIYNNLIKNNFKIDTVYFDDFRNIINNINTNIKLIDIGNTLFFSLYSYIYDGFNNVYDMFETLNGKLAMLQKICKNLSESDNSLQQANILLTERVRMLEEKLENIVNNPNFLHSVDANSNINNVNNGSGNNTPATIVDNNKKDLKACKTSLTEQEIIKCLSFRNEYGDISLFKSIYYNEDFDYIPFRKIKKIFQYRVHNNFVDDDTNGEYIMNLIMNEMEMTYIRVNIASHGFLSDDKVRYASSRL